MEVKNRLIKLFKQCCDNSNFIKDNKRVCNYQLSLSTEKEEFKTPNKLKEIIDDIGAEIESVDKKYLSVNHEHGYTFKFDNEPPLLLKQASIRLKLKLDSNLIEVGASKLKESSVITYKYKTFKNFWGREVTKMCSVNETYFEAPFIINEDSMSKLSKLRKVDEGEFNFSIPWYLNHGTTIHSNETDNFRFQSPFKKENFTKENIINRYSDFTIFVNGGLFQFGSLKCWLTYDEYNELTEYYKKSIDITYSEILDIRIDATK